MSTYVSIAFIFNLNVCLRVWIFTTSNVHPLFLETHFVKLVILWVFKKKIDHFCLIWFFALQKQQKYSENKLKALKARNDYLLCIESANSAISKYFSDDISDLMDVRLIWFFYFLKYGFSLLLFFHLKWLFGMIRM